MIWHLTKSFTLRVIPVEAGIQKMVHCPWIPASAGMTLTNVLWVRQLHFQLQYSIRLKTNLQHALLASA